MYFDPTFEGTFNKYEKLGMMSALALQSPLHRDWLLSDIELYLEPAIHSNQCQFFFRHGGLVAFATWASVDQDTHEKIIQLDTPVPKDKWTSGANTWLIDVVAPFGDAAPLVRHLQRNELAAVKRAYSVKRNLDGTRNRVKIWKNDLQKMFDA